MVAGEAEQATQPKKIVAAMMASGLYQQAAETLIATIKRDPARFEELWAFLRELSQRYDFADERGKKAVDELKRRLNVAVPWPAMARQVGDSLLDYPHVMERLVELWGRAECETYLRALLTDTRDGEREGFPPPVIEEILLLTGVHRRRRQAEEGQA